jgi:hypothetical protein
LVVVAARSGDINGAMTRLRAAQQGGDAMLLPLPRARCLMF